MSEKSSPGRSPSNPAKQTLQWLEQWVIGLNLCPFAAKVVNEKSVRIHVCDSQDDDSCIRAALEEMALIYESDEQTLSTSLLVYSEALQDFDHYLDVLDQVNDLLIEAGLEGVIQIASFHPQYCFEGVAENDVTNYSNRSPYPMLHFIREQQLEQALAAYPNAEQIPENNIQRLQTMGLAAALGVLSAISDS